MKMVTERSDNNAALPRVFCHNTYFFKKLTEESYDKVKRWTRKVFLVLNSRAYFLFKELPSFD